MFYARGRNRFTLYNRQRTNPFEITRHDPPYSEMRIFGLKRIQRSVEFASSTHNIGLILGIFNSNLEGTMRFDTTPTPDIRVGFSYVMTSTERNRPVVDNGKSTCALLGFPEHITSYVTEAYNERLFGRGTHIELKVWILTVDHKGAKSRKTLTQSGGCGAEKSQVRARIYSMCQEIEKDLKIWCEANIKTRDMSRAEAQHRIKTGAEQFVRHGKKGIEMLNNFMPRAVDTSPAAMQRRAAATKAYKRAQAQAVAAGASSGAGVEIPVMATAAQPEITELIKGAFSMLEPKEDGSPSLAGSFVKDALQQFGGLDGLKQKGAEFLPLIMGALAENGIEVEPIGTDDAQPPDSEETDGTGD